MIIYRQLAFSSLVDHETRSNVALTEVLSTAIWPQYRDLVRIDTGSRYETEKIHSAINRLDSVVKKLTQGSKLIKVKVYNLNGLTIYSSDPSQINQDNSNNEGFLSAKAGNTVSNITYRHELDTFEGKHSNINVVSSYIPIGITPSGEPEAVFEVYSDVTALVRDMHRLQLQFAVGILGSVALFYISLVVSSRRVDQIEAARLEDRFRSEEELHHQARHDPITDLPNRLNFNEKLEIAIKRAGNRNQKLAVIFVDIDRFKLVNDSFGYDAGDKLLRLTTDRLSLNLRLNDTLFHMGGDKFIVLLENLDNNKNAARQAKRMLVSMREPFIIQNQAFISTLSFGISINSGEFIDPARLVKNAEAAMYTAKQGGGNKLQFYLPEMNEPAHRQLVFESALQQALGNNEFVLHYQPRLAADEKTLKGLEALIRWQRADGTLVSPSDFVPILENKGLIHDVGQWVLYEACSQCRLWQDAGRDPVRISVNVSPLQFREPEFIEIIKNVLRETKLDARYLELELTESAFLENPSDTIVTMKELISMGITLSLDDFGTGYSSFSHLKKLPVDFLKIDRSFVHEIDRNSKDVAIISAIHSLAQNLGIGIVAEGIERHGQARKLIEAGCNELQGYLYSKALPADEAITWLPKYSTKNSVEQAKIELARKKSAMYYGLRAP